LLNIFIHSIGILCIVQIITHILAGSDRVPQSRGALNISVPVSIAYIIWLL